MKKLYKSVAALMATTTLVAGVARADLPVTQDLEVWLDASVGTMLNGAGSVTNWADQSGNAHHATQTGGAFLAPDLLANQWNGKSVIRFDAAAGDAGQDYLNFTPFAQTEDTSIFMVFRHDPTSPNPSQLLARSGATPSPYYGLSGGGNDPGIYPFLMFNTPDVMGTNVHRFAWTGTTSTGIAEIGIDGALNASAAHGASSLSVWTSIGDASFGQWIKGDVAEIILYERALNSAENQIVENHLSAKYDLPMAANNRYVGDDSAQGNYDTDVFGVGRVNAGNQLLSGSANTGLALSTGSLSDNQFVLGGHKVAVNAFTDADTDSGLRMERVWYLDATGSPVTDFAITFDFSEAGVGAPTAGSFQLLYAANNSFEGSESPFTVLSSSYTVVGDEVTFTLNGSQLLDGYYTFAAVPEPSTMLLFGVGGMLLWYRRRAGMITKKQSNSRNND